MTNSGGEQLSQLKVLEVGQLGGGPETLLSKYLRDRTKEFILLEVLNSEYYQVGMDTLRVSRYKQGKLVQKFTGGASYGFILRFRLTRRALLYVLSFALILGALVRLRLRPDICITYCVPFPILGILLKRLHLARRTIFISADHLVASARVNMGCVFVRLYRFIDRMAYNASDVVWYQSNKLIEVKEKEGFITKTNVPRLLVPIGVDLARFSQRSSEQVNRTSVGYVGQLTELMGLGLALDALAEVVRKVPNAKLRIIGSGPFEGELRKKTEDLRIGKNVEFLGFIGDRDEVMDIISKCAASLALYVPRPDSPIQFTDSAKVKEYMAYGTPIIVTRVTPIAAEIEESKAGFAVNYDKNEIAEAMTKLLTDDTLWQECRQNVRLLAIKYDYKIIYGKALQASGVWS